MGEPVSSLGVCIALGVSILLIIRKIHPVYALMTGAFLGGILGGCPAVETVSLMISGAGNLMQATLRVLGAGILTGVLIETGSARKIAGTLMDRCGHSRALVALVLSTMILTMVGVFVDVAVITVAPIALAVAVRANLSRCAVLIAMIGGGKAGNIMSPNPNTIVLSENLDIPLTNLMAAGIIPALGAIVMTCLVARYMTRRGTMVSPEELGERSDVSKENGPGFYAAIAGPIVAIALLALRPIAGIAIDPLIALPLGGIVGLCVMKKIGLFKHCADVGLSKMAPVALLLIGTGTLAGIISGSELKNLLIEFMEKSGIDGLFLAPTAGMLLSGATGSTTAACAISSSVFGDTIIQMGIMPLAAGIMIHAGATAFDSLPHGSFFHATGGSTQMQFGERLRLVPFDILIGLTQTVIATLLFCWR